LSPQPFYFSLKYAPNRSAALFVPDPTGGAQPHSAPPDPVVGEGRGGMEGRGEKRRKEGRTLPPLNLSLAMPLYKTLKVMNVRTIT